MQLNRWNKIFAAIAIFVVSLLSFADDTLTAADTTLEAPQLFRGRLTLHAPLTTFDFGNESTRSNLSWFPGAEMGFSFNPTMVSDDHYMEFPIYIQTIPPFFDEWAAMGDVGAGVYFRTYKNWGLGLNFRYLRVKYFFKESDTAAGIYDEPANVVMNGYLWGLDIAVPYTTLKMKGLKFEWLISGDLKYNDPPGITRHYKYYTGHAYFITPYWTFKMKYGTIDASYRILLAPSFKSTSDIDGSLRKARTPSVSEFEVIYSFP